MIVLAAMLIPFITAAVLWIWFRKEVVWWEFLIPFVSSLVLGLLVYLATTMIMTNRTEYLGGYISRATYYEPWNELVVYTDQEYCGTDSKGNPQYRTVIKTRVDYHEARWEATSSIGGSYRIDKELFTTLSRRWNSCVFRKMGHPSYTIHGDAYDAVYNSVESTMEVVTKSHRYENRVAVSKSVFNFREVGKKEREEKQIVDYPEITDQWNQKVVLGADLFGAQRADRLLSIFNGKYGAIKQVRVYLILFKDQTLEAGYAQQNYWKNGNMNEFVICIGVDKAGLVQWTHPFSWTDNSSLLVNCRDSLSSNVGKPLDFNLVLNWVQKEIPTGWTRKNFKKDFKYISIDPPFWVVVLTVVLSIVVNFFVSVWVISNEYAEEYSGAKFTVPYSSRLRELAAYAARVAKR